MPRPHQKGHKHSRRSHASPQTRWKSTKGSESDAARRLIRRSENGRLTLSAPYAERLQTQVPTTKSWSEANASSSS